MGEGVQPFLNIVVNSPEDVAPAKAIIAAGIPSSRDGATAAVGKIAEAAAVGDVADVAKAISSLSQHVDQLQSLALGQKIAQEYVEGFVVEAVPEVKKSK